MKKLLAAAALATVALSGVSGTAQAGYYGYSYGYSHYVKRFYFKRHYGYGGYYGY